MRLAGFIADWVEAKEGADALDDRRLARAAATDEDIEVWVKVNTRAIEESPFPG
jgi:hypothetical protein